jgi:uncharacterized small protein (DUF1192 family)
MISLSDDPSKAEEIAALRKFAAQVPEDSYLKGLFTNDLVAWFEQKVLEDWDTDLYGAMQFERSRRTTALSVVASKTDRIHGLKAEVERIGAEAQAKVTSAEKSATKWEAMYRETHAQMLDERSEWILAYSRALGAKHALRRALAKFRKIAGEREAKWKFTMAAAITAVKDGQDV